MRPRFHKTYAATALLLFLVELYIALYVRDGFVRPYLGDFLVVILIYCTWRAFFDGNRPWQAGGVFVFACMVEVAQYFDAVSLLGLADKEWARVIIGTRFVWEDILAYFLGVLAALGLESLWVREE